jgi:hypothetical protein
MSRFVLTAQLQLQAPNNVRQVVQQIQSQLQGVNVNVQIQNSPQAQRQLQQVTQQVNQATTAAERMGKAFALSIRRFAAFSVATRAVGLFTSTLNSAVNSAIDFERQLIKVSQVTGKSVGQLRGLTKQITSLSTGFGVASSDLLEVSTVLAQAGLTAEDTSIALKTLAKAALAPNFDSITETAEGAIAILAQFQQGVGALEQQLGSINAVAGAFAVEASDLIDVVRRTGGVFKASGGNLNELLALFTSVRATTRESAESIGTGLRTIFTRIQRPKTIEFLKQFGVELTDLDGKFVGPYEAIKRLSEALSGLGEGDLTFISIAEELGGFRQIGKVLPLLQQFSTAQSALNVAMKAGDSLTNDAASAQAALAIRIMKVKEEFLALIRSVTETSTFQVMANTALSLASALIKIGDSIKPLLPMLAALAAFKLVKGMGGFLGGMMSGATSGRAYNKGGKVLGFARGGLVPGSGNGDTVPAMLAPGEFVIRKSSVNKMGAGTLAAMNENRYENGGPMTTAQKLAMARGPQKTQSLGKKDKKAKYTSGRDKDELRFSVADGSIGAFFMNKEGTPDGLKPFKSKSFNITNSELLSLAGVKPYKNKGDKMAGKSDTFFAKGILEAGNIQTFYPSIGDIKSGSLSQIIQNNVKTKLSEAVASVANEVSSKKLLDIPPVDSNDALLSAAAKRIQSDAGAIRTTSGYLYEGVIDALTGARPASGNAVFDFPASSLQGNRQRLAALFGNAGAIGKLRQADAKASYSSKIIDGDMGSGSISSKIVNSINNGVLAGINVKKKFFGGPISKFAAGGGVGTDTVPALLTPGEFVVNRSSAQNIGYGNLNRMNKVGKYAKGGVVQRFAAGTSGTGAKSIVSDSNIPGFDIKAPTVLNKIISKLTGTFSVMDVSVEEGRKQFQVLKAVTPDLSKSLVDYANANNLSFKQAAQLSSAYSQLVTQMLKQGASSAVIQIRMQDYVDALTSGAKAIGTTASETASSSATSPASSAAATAATATTTNKAGGAVTSSNVKSKISGLADNGEIQREIAATAQEIKKTGSYSKVLSTSLEKQKQVTDGLYQESAALDARISAYDQALAKLATQQGKAAATGTAANRIVQMKMDAESKRIEVDQRALAEEQKFEGIQKKHQATIEKQTQLMDKQNALIQQAKSNKQAASQLTKDTLQGGTQSNFKDSDTRANSRADSWNQLQKQKADAISARENEFARARTANKERQSQRSGGLGSMMPSDVGGAAIAISMVTASLQAMLPPLDENSSALTTMSHSLLGLVTTVAGVAFALQAFGVELKAQSVMKFLGGGGLGTGGKKAVISAAQGLGFGRDATVGIMKTVNAISKIAGPLLAVAGGAYLAQQAFNVIAESIYNFDGRLKQSIESGDVEGAKTAAREKADFQQGSGAIGGVLAATAAGAAIGSFIPVIGTVIGGLVGLGVGILGVSSSFLTTTDSAVALAAAQAGAVKTQKALDEAQKVAATAMDDFKNGTISASEALAKIRAKTGEANAQMGRANTFATENLKNRSNAYSDSGFLRNVGALGGLNPFMETTGARNARLGKESADQINNAAKQQQEAFNIESPARQAAIRSGVARGKNINAVRAEATNGLQKQISEQRLLGNQLQSSGDEAGAKAAFAAASQMEAQLKQVNKEIENIEKEVKRQKELYDAMNLGLRSATATSSALSATMDRFSAGFEVGGSTLGSDIEFLQQSMSSAAQAMDPNEIKDAVSNVSSNLREFGVGEEYIKKFEGNVAAFTSAQQNYNKAFDNIKNSMAEADFKGLSSDEIKKKFADELTKGMDEEGAKSLKAAIGGMDLSDTDVDQIIAGDLSVFGNKLTEVQKKMFEDLQKIEQDRARAEQVLIDFTKKRIDAERNLVAAQQEALDLTLEGREVQAKYGGKAVSAEERRANILGKSNVEGNRLGLTAMRTGSIQELRARNAEIRGGFANVEARRTERGGMDRTAGVVADESQKDLEKAYKTQIETIRGLIKLEEEQLKITQEKNKLEKESMESLIKGDVEEFFKKQSAVGATAAIASGDTRLQNYYGADALGMAYQDIQRQQEAGVQELYGQQLGGAGGLVESAAGAALSARGVTDMRAAQVMAGTTAEEEASKSRLRELGGMLGETGQLGTEMAEMQVTTATMNVTAAQVKFDETMARGRAKAEEGLASENKSAAEFKSRGGLIYASRGIFVPRGTDTVPAMLTPGEFVVNRAAVQRDNNLQILQAMNGNSSPPPAAGQAVGMAKGGMVQYFRDGGQPQGGGSFAGMFAGITDGLSKFATSFGSQISEAVDKLKGINITLSSNSNVNVNINDSSGLLKMLKEDTRKDILAAIEREFKDSQGGSLKRNSSVLGS